MIRFAAATVYLQEALNTGRTMNRVLFEGRFLINMAASVVRQDDLRPIHGKMDWERMYRIADYNRIANLIYIGVLGNEKVPQNWRDHFFERYQESLRFGDFCEEAEKEILTLLDFKEVPALVLESSSRRELYEMKEMAGECPLRLYVKPEDYTLVKGYLIDLGYETDRVYGSSGERMRRIGGFSVEIYSHFPYRTELYRKKLRQLFNRARLFFPYKHIYCLTEKDRLSYLFARAAYYYATDQLLARHLLDLCILYRSLKEENMEEMWKWMRELKISVLSRKLLGLGYMWFGTKEESAAHTEQKELEIYDVIESRILGYGKEAREVIPEALALEGAILKEEEKENRKARRKLMYQKMKDLCSQMRECMTRILQR